MMEYQLYLAQIMQLRLLKIRMAAFSKDKTAPSLVSMDIPIGMENRSKWTQALHLAIRETT